ncbi:MAG: hypothetical protein JJ992_13845, partial [Planctomycetes bacterium]|nr:hypothetical protein [Planctomycetota bacterium]
MQNLAMLEWALIGSLCAVVASVTVFWLSERRVAGGNRAVLLGPDDGFDPVWLYDGQGFIDANSSAEKLMQGEAARDWQSLCGVFAERFPDFPMTLERIRTEGTVVAPAEDPADETEVQCEWLDGITRVRLRGGHTADETARRLAALDPDIGLELQTLRAAMNETPYPVWRIDSENRLAWYNAAYLALCHKVTGAEPDLDKPLFATDLDLSKKTRQSISVSGSDQRMWFDVSAVRQSTGTMFYAADINAVVDAEIAV